jgi:hypothetical protein
MRKNGIEPDLGWRPCPPQGNGFFAKLIRSWQKHGMDRRRAAMVTPPAMEISPLSLKES